VLSNTLTKLFNLNAKTVMSELIISTICYLSAPTIRAPNALIVTKNTSPTKASESSTSHILRAPVVPNFEKLSVLSLKQRGNK